MKGSGCLGFRGFKFRAVFRVSTLWVGDSEIKKNCLGLNYFVGFRGAEMKRWVVCSCGNFPK